MAAVQALYQHAATGAPAETIVEEFFVHRAEDGSAGVPREALRSPFFRDLVEGAIRRLGEIDGLIQSCLTNDRTLERIERPLLAVLRVGAYELIAHPEIPARVTIAEYLAVADAFLAQQETAFVNAVLDAVGRARRTSEMGVKDPYDQARQAR
jgi:N utilization substance protein B